MDPISVIALVLSVIAILLWVYSYLFQPARETPRIQEQKARDMTSEEPGIKPMSPQVTPGNPDRQSPSLQEQFIQMESQFRKETQKFSQMVHKNLEMLNTRVGIKFDVKPLPEKYSAKKSGPDYVDSMDVSERQARDMISDKSDEQA